MCYLLFFLPSSRDDISLCRTCSFEILIVGCILCLILLRHSVINESRGYLSMFPLFICPTPISCEVLVSRHASGLLLQVVCFPCSQKHESQPRDHHSVWGSCGPAWYLFAGRQYLNRQCFQGHTGQLDMSLTVSRSRRTSDLSLAYIFSHILYIVTDSSIIYWHVFKTFVVPAQRRGVYLYFCPPRWHAYISSVDFYICFA